MRSTTHISGRAFANNATQAWHSACNIAWVAEAYAASPERFPTEESCFTARHLLPFRLPQVPCSPQAQGTSPLSSWGHQSHHERAKETLSESYGLYFWLRRLRRRRGLLQYLRLQAWEIPGVAGSLTHSHPT